MTPLLGLFAGGAVADDLTGAGRLLCTAVEANVCSMEGACESAPPWRFNIPQFIEVDLEAGTLSTTEASGENRSTPIKNLEREEGLIFLQGVEVARGPGSVGYGSDAFGGVIHARTRRVEPNAPTQVRVKGALGAGLPEATVGALVEQLAELKQTVLAESTD